MKKCSKTQTRVTDPRLLEIVFAIVLSYYGASVPLPHACYKSYLRYCCPNSNNFHYFIELLYALLCFSGGGPRPRITIKYEQTPVSGMHDFLKPNPDPYRENVTILFIHTRMLQESRRRAQRAFGKLDGP